MKVNKQAVKDIFYSIKKGRFLEWIAWYRERRIVIKEGFTGDKNNAIDVIKYENALGNAPVAITKKRKDKITYIYEDGLEADIPKYNL